MAFLENLDFNTISDPRVREYIDKSLERNRTFVVEGSDIKVYSIKDLVKKLILASTSRKTDACTILFRKIMCETSRNYYEELTGGYYQCHRCCGCNSLSIGDLMEKINTFIESNS